jgi:hypothetical protein
MQTASLGIGRLPEELSMVNSQWSIVNGQWSIVNDHLSMAGLFMA